MKQYKIIKIFLAYFKMRFYKFYYLNYKLKLLHMKQICAPGMSRTYI